MINKRSMIALLFILIIAGVLIRLVLFSSSAKAEAGSKICVVYFTGIGCPHCANTDPVVLGELTKKYPNLIVIEYEIYQQQENAPLLYNYNSNYGSGFGIPLIIFSKNKIVLGDIPILQSIEEIIKGLQSNECPLMDGSSVSFDDLDLTSLPGSPKIWVNERVLISSSNKNADNQLLKELLTKDPSSILKSTPYETIEPRPVPLSGSSVKFKNAVKIIDWIFEWGVPTSSADGSESEVYWDRIIIAIVIVILAVSIVFYLMHRKRGG